MVKWAYLSCISLLNGAKVQWFESPSRHLFFYNVMLCIYQKRLFWSQSGWKNLLPPYLLRSQKMTLDNPLSYPGHSLLLHRPSIITSSWQSLKQVLNLFCFLSVLAFIPHKNSLITFNENIFYVTLTVTCLLKCSFGANLLQLKTSWKLLFPHFYYLNKSNFFAQLSRALRS